jgi:hypothetical protein
MQFAKAAEHLAPYETEISMEDAEFNRRFRDTV